MISTLKLIVIDELSSCTFPLSEYPYYEFPPEVLQKLAPNCNTLEEIEAFIENK